MMLQPTVESIADYADIEIFFHDKEEIGPGGYYQAVIEKSFKGDFDTKSDLVLYIGAGNGPRTFPPEVLKLLNRDYNFLHICTDGGCPGWWDTAKAYKEAGIKQVNIDGSFNGPKGLFDLVTLTPPNPKYYKIKPWEERTIELGFMGGTGSLERSQIINELGDIITVNYNRNEGWGSYQAYAEFMCDCKCVLNMSRTGSNREYHHVKNRVLETAMAQACLFEQDGSPLSKWFDPEKDYFKWQDIEQIRYLDNHLWHSHKKLVAKNLYQEVMAEHNAKIWFDKVLNLL